MSISWWRSWHGAPMDHKWTLIATRAGVKTGIVSAIAWALMDYASQHKQRGSIEGFDIEVYAVYSGFSETEISAVIQAMRDKGVIAGDRLTNWEKRQPQREDYSTDRVREWRAMKRNETQCNTKISPDKDKDKDKDIKEDEEGETPDVFDLYEQNIGTITPMLAEKLKDAEKDFPAEWIIEAFKVATANNARSWAYVQAILDRWQVDGFKTDTRIRKNGKQKDNEPAGFQGIREFLEEQKNVNSG